MKSICQRLALPLISSLLFSSCVTHTHATEFNGLAGIRGEPVEYQSTSTWSFNLLFIFSMIGDTSQEASIDAFTQEASQRGGKRVSLQETSKSVYWYIFPPISFFIHPVEYTVKGSVEGTVATDE
jgi:hypothetical protein